MQTKPLTVDTQRIVDELRALKAAVELLHGPQGNTAILGRAISRLSYLDVDRERLLVWLEEERTKTARLEVEHAEAWVRANDTTRPPVVAPTTEPEALHQVDARRLGSPLDGPTFVRPRGSTPPVRKRAARRSSQE